ncbi:hypothetical protein TVAG_246700 [Trichomonas vaginalis G3]|uniref:ATP-dependent rRNA helicase SPB4-like C-terminal extension domain-containing protein n=1 Tax=Trichomonas vaginalis (strain ATCC PRA-98 / G3) TaxID=412133 RepID=A2DKK9_TRIV3|nr:helicase protein [Trichomonas vaginalis G3]EAY18992.1 hypothetical protein TVAG_246700 [Trichomonas vaginalis G3]KAI5521215.1 helicase protein [Trichomonas vaginalis G3]|eukprot:XP_001579978.1 hypothetical protein [Trichomonas vaginalis G3]
MSTSSIHYYCPVSFKYRLPALVEFVKSHFNKDKIVIICNGPKQVEFLSHYFILLQMTPCRIVATMSQEDRQNAEQRFQGAINICLVSQSIVENVKLGNPTWVVEYAVPTALSSYVKMVQNIKAPKWILFVEPNNEKAFIERCKSAGLESKELPVTVNKLPNIVPRLLGFLDRRYEFYMSSQFGYREMISAYVNSENEEFNAQKLNLLEASISFGIEHPPKLPLTK